MSRDRFFDILSMLHFCNNKERPKDDRLIKVRKVFAKLKKFNKKGGRPTFKTSPFRMVGRHCASLVPSTQSRKKSVRRCKVCSTTKLRKRVRKETSFMCKTYDVSLCITSCFELPIFWNMLKSIRLRLNFALELLIICFNIVHFCFFLISYFSTLPMYILQICALSMAIFSKIYKNHAYLSC